MPQYGRVTRRLIATAAAVVLGSALTVVTGAGPVQGAPVDVVLRVTAADTGLPFTTACGILRSATDPFVVQPGICADAEGIMRWPTVPDGEWTTDIFDSAGSYAGLVRPITVQGSDPIELELAMPVGAAISGRLVDRITGDPVAGMCVYAYLGRSAVRSPGQNIGCSDETGRWTTTAVTPGPVTVFAQTNYIYASGWAEAALTQSGATLYQAVAGGTTELAAPIRLYRTGSLSGRITDRRGRPIAGANVVVGNYDTFSGMGDFSTQTDARGRYTLTGVPPSSQPVLVNVPGQPYAWQWSGEVADPVRAQSVTVRSGRTTRFDAQLAPQAPLDVTVDDPMSRYGWIDVFTLSGAPVGFFASVKPGETSTVSGLPSSRVRVRVTFQDGTSVWYPSASSEAGAALVRVNSAARTSITITAG